MPRFTLKRMMLIVSLLAVEAAVLMPTIGPFAEYRSIRYIEILIVLWLALGRTVGSVMAAPLKIAGTGAIIGVLINFFAIMFGIGGHVFY